MLWRLLLFYSAIVLLVMAVLAYRLLGSILTGSFRTEQFSLFGPPPKCPFCGARIHLLQWPTCRACGNSVQLRPSYRAAMLVVTFLLSGLIAFAVGATGDVWLWTTLLGAHPLGVVLYFLTWQLLPPDIEPTGDYRSILYESGRSKDQEPDGPGGTSKKV